MKALLAQFDHFQQRTPWLAFPIAVAKKFGDDEAGYLASLVAYYGFFSLFPLLLVFSTVLGFVLQGHAKLQQTIIHSALGTLPIIGSQIKVHSLRGSGIGLVVGIVFTLLAGIAVIQAMEYDMDEIWGIPFVNRANWLLSRVRAIIMLAVLGITSLVATALSSVTSAGGHVWLGFRILGPIASLFVNFATLTLAFRILTAADLAWGDVVVGAATAAVVLDVLELLGSLYIGRVLKHASQTYGTFGTIIALLSWLYLGAQITFYGAEINVVKAKRLWPRSIVAPTMPTDHKALTMQATKQQRRSEQSIEVQFGHVSESPGEPRKAKAPGQ